MGQIKVNYDKEEDILMFSKGRKVKSSIDVGDFVIDVDMKEFISGIEILNASKNLNVSEEQLNDIISGNMTINYKPNSVFISIFLKLKDKEKDIGIPLKLYLLSTLVKIAKADEPKEKWVDRDIVIELMQWLHEKRLNDVTSVSACEELVMIYDAILLDPPSFGRGPKGELWKVEQQIGSLLENIRTILDPDGGMVVLTMYNLEASSLMLKCLMEDYFPGGHLEFGELALPCTESTRMLPLSLFARWEA